MLKHRLLTAIILIPLVLLALFFLPLSYFAAVIIVLCGIGAWEWAQLVGITHKSVRAIGAVLIMVFLAILYYGLNPVLFSEVVLYSLVLAWIWWLLALYLVITYPKCAVFWRDHTVIKTAFGFCTLFPFFTAMITLRSANYSSHPFMGAILVLYVLILIWATDSGAYFIGRALGKHKLAPSVSPGKTLEGFIGGVVLAFILACIVNFYSPWAFSMGKILLVSLITILASVLGDLTESMFKRAAGIKDSGNLIPGHGGILDRLDSLMAAAPIFVALFLFVI